MRYNEKKGHWPLMKGKRAQSEGTDSGNISSGEEEGMAGEKKEHDSRSISTKIRSVES